MSSGVGKVDRNRLSGGRGEVECVVALPGVLHDGLGSPRIIGIKRIGFITRAARQSVVSRTANQDVIQAVAGQPIVTGTADSSFQGVGENQVQIGIHRLGRANNGQIHFHRGGGFREVQGVDAAVAGNGVGAQGEIRVETKIVIARTANERIVPGRPNERRFTKVTGRVENITINTASQRDVLDRTQMVGLPRVQADRGILDVAVTEQEEDTLKQRQGNRLENHVRIVRNQQAVVPRGAGQKRRSIPIGDIKHICRGPPVQLGDFKRVVQRERAQRIPINIAMDQSRRAQFYDRHVPARHNRVLAVFGVQIVIVQFRPDHVITQAASHHVFTFVTSQDVIVQLPVNEVRAVAAVNDVFSGPAGIHDRGEARHVGQNDRGWDDA